MTANAANIIRNPVSTRTEPLPHKETTTSRLSGWRFCLVGRAFSDVGTSPSVASTQDGMRIDCPAAATQINAVNHNAPAEPNTELTPLAMPPNTPAAASPNTVSRAFVFDSVTAGGTTRGVTADFSTVNDFDSTIMPSAAGYRPQSLKCSAMIAAIRPWPSEDTHIASLRPRWIRSSAGPITGATSANGAIVMSRYSATRSRLSPLAAAKNRVFASATAIAASLA